MDNIIVAYSTPETAQKIKKVLVGNGFTVNGVCTSASQVLELSNKLDEGVIISGLRLTDTVAITLANQIPTSFELLILAPSSQISLVSDRDISCVSLPLNKADFIDTVNMLLDTRPRYNKISKSKNSKEGRTDEDKEIIQRAKELLMERNHLTEMQAHRFIQKKSMDMGHKMVDTAKIIINRY